MAPGLGFWTVITPSLSVGVTKPKSVFKPVKCPPLLTSTLYARYGVLTVTVCLSGCGSAPVLLA